ncbi:MAG: molybdopterin-synthase adenylyltransferase MoeB [Pseudomonadota bacterium]
MGPRDLSEGEVDLAGETVGVNFSASELERYARHIVLREVGGPGQQRLKSARVLVIGAGGLGSPVLLYLAAAGVGQLGIVDDDTVSLSNLQRQVLHDTNSIGEPKTASAQETLTRLNPEIEVKLHTERFGSNGSSTFLEEYDLVIDGSDNFATRYAVNAACVAAGKPLLSGAISRWEGQISLYDPSKGGPCYACIFPEAPEPGSEPPCAEAGVIGALPGVVGSIMALEAIKEIAGTGQSLRGVLLLFDGLRMTFQRISLKRSPDCPVCGSS